MKNSTISLDRRNEINDTIQEIVERQYHAQKNENFSVEEFRKEKRDFVISLDGEEKEYAQLIIREQ